QNNRIAMADLRDMLGSLGLADVRTHILSGNALFTSDRWRADQLAGESELAGEIERAIERRFDLKIAVLVRTAADLAAAMEANPLSEATSDPSHFYAIFLSENPSRERIASIDPGAFDPEKVAFG